jgi:hypothetical protein
MDFFLVAKLWGDHPLEDDVGKNGQSSLGRFIQIWLQIKYKLNL